MLFYKAYSIARDKNFVGAHAQGKQALSDISFIRQNIVQLYLKHINAEAGKKKQKKRKKPNGLPGHIKKQKEVTQDFTKTFIETYSSTF